MTKVIKISEHFPDMVCYFSLPSTKIRTVTGEHKDKKLADNIIELCIDKILDHDMNIEIVDFKSSMNMNDFYKFKLFMGNLTLNIDRWSGLPDITLTIDGVENEPDSDTESVKSIEEEEGVRIEWTCDGPRRIYEE